MPDLHGWITKQIAMVEATAREATSGPWFADHPEQRYWGDDPEARVIGGGKTLGVLSNDYNGHVNADHIALHDPASVLRRCEADRKILARHTLDPGNWYEPACLGCGTYGDMDLPETDNLNDCPELLDLGYAHGLTEEILATLDQPEKPPRPPRPEPKPPVNLATLVRIMSAQPTSSVPPTLRGPNWEATP